MTQALTWLAAAILLVPNLTIAAAGTPDRHAVFKSTDRGRSWSRADTGLLTESRINAFGAVDTTLLAGTDSGVFSSTDEAKSWRPPAGQALPSGRVICFATLDQTVFAGTDGKGLWGSENRGQTWVRSATFPSNKVRCLLAREGRIYAGTDAAGVFVSLDAGKTWTQLHAGLPAHAQVFSLAAVEDRVFAALYRNGLFAWHTREQQWSKTGTVAPLALATTGGTLIAGHNPGGLYWSSDLGASWSKGSGSPSSQAALGLPNEAGDLPDEAPVWELAASDEVLLAGASAGIYSSEDRGRTWVKAISGLPTESPGVSFFIRPTFVLAATPVKSPRLH